MSTRKTANTRRILALSIGAAVTPAILVPTAVSARPATMVQDTKREVLIDFPAKRPKPKKAINRRPPVYRFAEERAGTAKGPLSTDAELGLTVWHLRPARRTDTGARTLLSGDERTEYVAIRATTDAPLRPEERVRLSIESAREGFLYVVDRELFANGQTGPPNLIFPGAHIRGGDNKVRAGKLVEIPDRDDAKNYFRASPSQKNQIGEVLTIIVTGARLNVRPGPDGLIPASDLARWEAQWGRGIQKFEMVGGEGQQWTEAEKQAGSKSGPRLTQDQAAPQTVFSSPEPKEDGLMISVTLHYVRPGASRRRH